MQTYVLPRLLYLSNFYLLDNLNCLLSSSSSVAAWLVVHRSLLHTDSDSDSLCISDEEEVHSTSPLVLFPRVTLRYITGVHHSCPAGMRFPMNRQSSDCSLSRQFVGSCCCTFFVFLHHTLQNMLAYCLIQTMSERSLQGFLLHMQTSGLFAVGRWACG